MTDTPPETNQKVAKSPSLNPQDVYELIENDKGEIMLIIYATEQEPQNPSFDLNEKARRIELTRGKDDILHIEGLQTETIEKFKTVEKLYICEMKYNPDNNTENEIMYAYTALLKKKEQNEAQPPKQSNQKPEEAKKNLSEKVRQAREEALKRKAQAQTQFQTQSVPPQNQNR